MTVFVNNKHIYCVEPKNIGGTIEEVLLEEGNFSLATPARNRTRTRPKSYLVVGFDTEYKSHEPLSREELKAGAKNKLLSYQFFIRKVDEVRADGPFIEAEGIIVPEGDERLSLGDFIAIAAGSLVKKYPGIVLPTDILLVGHFTRADFPAFEDFKGAAKEFTANIRNTFVTLEKAHSIIIRDTPVEGGPPGQGLDVIGTFNVTMRDTILHAPAGKKALADIGEMIGETKIVLHSDPIEEQQIKENMDVFMRDHWPEFRHYAIQDARICVVYAEMIVRQSQEMFGEFKMPVTLTSFGTTQVLEGWKELGWDRNAILGRQEVAEKKFSKRLGRYVKTMSRPFITKVHEEQDFVTACYHGGRNEQYVFGPAPESDYRDMDLSSAYTTAMSLICLADWNAMHPVDDLNSVKATDLAFFRVEFEFPPSVRFPVLPVCPDVGIIFPRKGISDCCAPEIVLALSLGAKLKLLKGVNVPTDQTRPVFKPFITHCIKQRANYEKNTFGNLFWKEVGNSTYGKTAQGLRKRRVYDLRDESMMQIGESPVTQPFFAAFITSFTRAVLGEFLNGMPASALVFSATTDGFLSNASFDEIDTAEEMPLAKIFRAAGNALTGKDKALEEKHNVRRPMGWRTRGSATLVPGTGKDRCVLQKGGIKTKRFGNVELENNEIVDLFLNRTPESKRKFSVGISVRDLMNNDLDFMYREVEKHLGMEFDWKRWPVDPCDIDIEFNGVHYTHLGFNTKPLENVEEFDRVRDAWERYSKGQRRILKTKKDFDQFQVFLEAGKMDGKARAYVAREDGHLKRARRDLLRAYRSGNAGFDRVKSRTGKFKHSRMASILTSHGIPCTVTNIDNERGKAFVPHQTMRHPRVEQALRSLQRDVFPELDVDLLLAAG